MKINILVSQQPLKGTPFRLVKVTVCVADKGLQQGIQLQHAAPALPKQTARRQRAHRARFTSKLLILPMAAAGFKPLGQTSTQFMMPWHRKSR